MHDAIQTGGGVCQLLEGRVGSSDNKAGMIKSLWIGKLKIVRQHFQSHREQNHTGPLWEWDIHTLLLIKTKQKTRTHQFSYILITSNYHALLVGDVPNLTGLF